ncbi:MAG: homoserine kinase [Melioribacteraceae bacterium]|nr:homoserine kinase [Melioribacteraceae bacterium]MCF8264903.1 homoserine kinase [Melioribacteraceae bacterium]MCF8414127.1 homoserine kinase [Melioribacteraceae bacterium]MCF8432166.1 homoserine kinase [Melioribacteraceae bacterium]
MSSNSIKVFAPASVSNVGPGFDIMGFALNEPGDEVTVTKSDSNDLVITNITGDNGKLPFEILKNTTTFAMKSMIDFYGLPGGYNVQINKKMGIGSGLGSSAASAVAGVFALNKLLNLRLKKKELLDFAVQGESIASNAIHADNVAPALYGGFVLIRGYNPIDVIKIDTPSNLFCSIIYPAIEIKTSEARKILPKSVSIKTAVEQAGNSAGLVTGLMQNDFNLISRSLIDSIAEPRRAKLLPFYEEVRKSALASGALNCNITGSGPSIFAFSLSKNNAVEIAVNMKKTISDFGVEGQTYVSKINKVGPKVLD